MVQVIPVQTASQQRDFIEFPLRLYKGCPYFVPPLYAEEKKLFSPDYCYYDTCLAQHFVAYREGKPVGRIQAILQKVSNELRQEKRARFSRFDSINDPEVSRALFAAAEDWALEQGMDTVCGPLGFSDLEREGLLIQGFDQLSTFEEQYNYDYYPALMEDSGYRKEVDWFEYSLRCPEPIPQKVERVSNRVMERGCLHIGTAPNKKAYIEKYKDGIFLVLDECYKKLYGTVPFTENMKKQLIDQFMLIIDLRYVVVICDREENVIAFGLCFPSIGEALTGSSGRLTPGVLLRLLRALKSPKVIDLGLVAVLPKWQNEGVNAVALYGLMRMMQTSKVEHLETNLCLEYNSQVQAQWKYFIHEIHKKRRSYLKKLTPSPAEGTPDSL